MPVPVPRSPVSIDLVAAMEGEVRGRPVQISTLARVEPDAYRVWAGPYVFEGHEYVEVVLEHEWWRHELMGARPTLVLRWPVGAVFSA